MHLLPDSGLSPPEALLPFSFSQSQPTPLTPPPPLLCVESLEGWPRWVPEVSLTLSALFSVGPSPSLLLQGEWKPLSHPPILPVPHSTPWRIFQQPPACLPVSWPLMTSPSRREGETSKRIYIPAGQAEGGRLGSQGPSPQSWAHMHTEDHCPTNTDPCTQMDKGRGYGGHRLLRKRIHTRKTYMQFIQKTNHKQAIKYKSQNSKRLGTK